jgi:hypothetical protein
MNDLTAALRKPTHLISLASSGVLVNVETHAWGATKGDRVISEEVAVAKRANSRAGRYTKNLLAEHPKHKAILTYRQTIYNWLKKRTFPWNDAQSYLPHVELVKFRDEYDAHRLEFQGLVEDFLMDYQNIVSDMAFHQGDMFNRDDYPPVDKVRNKFGIELYINEVPSNDYRCLISNALADDLFESYSRQTESILKNVVSAQQQSMVKVLESLSKSCTDTSGMVDPNDPNKKLRRRKVHSGTLDKARELCRLYEQFNPAGDQSLMDAIKALDAALAGVDVDSIRDSDAVRSEVKREVDTILNSIKSNSAVPDELY